MVTKSYIDGKLKTLKTDIKRENNELMDKLEGMVYNLEKENDDVREQITKLEKRLDEGGYGDGEATNRLNDMEQHGRNSSIRIISMQDEDDKESVEDCVEKVVKFINDKMNVPVRSEDIDIAHRFGKFNKERPRSTIVKFTRMRTKHDVIKARRNLRGTGYVVFEDLTRLNQQTLKDKLKNVQNSYSLDGKLFVGKTFNNKFSRAIYCPQAKTIANICR